MPVPSNSNPAADGALEDPPETRTYLLVVVTEVVVIAALYWHSAHFS